MTKSELATRFVETGKRHQEAYIERDATVGSGRSQHNVVIVDPSSR